MLLHPKMNASTEITNQDDEMVQMHALDIRIDKLYSLKGHFTLNGETSRRHRQTEEVYVDDKGFFELKPNTIYAFDANHKVEMALGEAGWIIGRSTLQRNGIIVQSALYDAGYIGGINGTIFNATNDFAYIKQGSRIGQFLLVEAETYKLYEGVYNEVRS